MLRRRVVPANLRKMSMRPIHSLRALTGEEERVLQRTAKATSARVDLVKRAKALLAVKAGQGYTAAAQEAGYKSGDSVSQLVERFNQRGLAVLEIASGRGRKETYTSEQRARILAEVQRVPDREKDGTAMWSLSTLERALRKEALPHISATTIREVLSEAGYAFGKTRTWCPTGTALRVRKAGTVKVEDPQAQGKNADRTGICTSRDGRAAAVVSR
jgi:transposase